eukprot:7490877-Pyramimonas_sp.AAC.1
MPSSCSTGDAQQGSFSSSASARDAGGSARDPLVKTTRCDAWDGRTKERANSPRLGSRVRGIDAGIRPPTCIEIEAHVIIVYSLSQTTER